MQEGPSYWSIPLNVLGKSDFTGWEEAIRSSTCVYSMVWGYRFLHFLLSSFKTMSGDFSEVYEMLEDKLLLIEPFLNGY